MSHSTVAPLRLQERHHATIAVSVPMSTERTKQGTLLLISCPSSIRFPLVSDTWYNSGYKKNIYLLTITMKWLCNVVHVLAFKWPHKSTLVMSLLFQSLWSMRKKCLRLVMVNFIRLLDMSYWCGTLLLNLLHSLKWPTTFYQCVTGAFCLQANTLHHMWNKEP